MSDYTYSMVKIITLFTLQCCQTILNIISSIFSLLTVIRFGKSGESFQTSLFFLFNCTQAHTIFSPFMHKTPNPYGPMACSTRCLGDNAIWQILNIFALTQRAPKSFPLSLSQRKTRSSVSSVYVACHSAHGEHTVYWKRGQKLMYYYYYYKDIRKTYCHL